MRIGRRTALLFAAATAGLLHTGIASAADITWLGNGGDDNWSTGSNWSSGASASPNDNLFFDGTNRLTPSNDTAAGTAYNGITFNPTAGAFTLAGQATSDEVSPLMANLWRHMTKP